MSDDKQRLEEELRKVRKRLHLTEIKLLIAHRWVELMRQAHAALLHHGINFYVLKEYLHGYPDDIEKMHPEKSRDAIIGWIEGVSSGIKAAVRRKAFKQV